MSKWQVANYGTIKQRWFIYRELADRWEIGRTKNGQLRRFATREAAQKVAEHLNREEASRE